MSRTDKDNGYREDHGDRGDPSDREDLTKQGKINYIKVQLRDNHTAMFRDYL